MPTLVSGYNPNNNFFTRKVGEKHYELTDHASTTLSTGASTTLSTGTSATLSTGLGNVRASVTDRKIASFQYPQGGNWTITGFTTDITSAQDYYPFGWTMPGRQLDPGEYLYSLNTQEKGDEIKGSGNHITAKYWEYYPRIGRRWNMDSPKRRTVEVPNGDSTDVYDVVGPDTLDYYRFPNSNSDPHEYHGPGCKVK